MSPVGSVTSQNIQYVCFCIHLLIDYINHSDLTALQALSQLSPSAISALTQLAASGFSGLNSLSGLFPMGIFKRIFSSYFSRPSIDKYGFEFIIIGR